MEPAITLKEWLENHLITYSMRKDVLVIPGFGRCLIQDKYDHIFKENKKGEVVFNSIENFSYLLADEIFYIVFPFGCRWYYIDIRQDPADVQFNILRYVGDKPKFNHECIFYPLGIHSGYELLNGSGLLKDWCAKAKFLGYGGLSVADKNTMAASLDLQQSATSKDLKYCFGYSLTIRIGNDKVGAKVYSLSQRGFKNLLRIQKVIAIDNIETKEIDLIDLLNLADGNVLVFDKWSGHWLAENKGLLQDFIDAFEGWVFFQVDTSEYRADRIDSAMLQSQKAYFDNFYLGNLEYAMNIRPVLIQDTYYIDKEDWRSKIVLNKVDTGAAHNQSYKQYLKNIDELYDEFRNIFSEKYDDDVFYDMCESTADIIENATASYDTSSNYMPEYEMTDEELKKYGTKLNMFNSLIESGFKKLVPEGQEERYRKRLEYEKYVIESTDNVDYILIQYDEIRWAKENGILTGIGRGSAAGCLLLYLIGITNADPIQYDLIFERFLIPERAGLKNSLVTILADDFISEEYVEIKFDNNISLKFDIDSELRIKRQDSELTVYADELQQGDLILFDKRELNYYLPFKENPNITLINIIHKKEKVYDCYVDSGYVKVGHGSLADVDIDFDSTKKDEVKSYLERRYNKNGKTRVFSAGTFTTLKIKSAIKDIARTYKIPVGTVNYLTSIIKDSEPGETKEVTWTDFMKLAFKEKKLYEFVQKYPGVFEDILPVMGQPRSSGIHASAIIITPEFVNGSSVSCFDLFPMRKMNDLIVSEISGADIDVCGFLKNDVLSITELNRISNIFQLIKTNYGVSYTILEIITKYLNDPKVFEMISEGYTQGIFQLSGEGMTKFIKRMKPSNINDMLALVALFRPGPLESGTADYFVRVKRGEIEPSYLWGTEDILKPTYGAMIYQESISLVAQKIGSLSLGDGVDLVKALSKKKLEKVRVFKDKFFEGAKKNGCPIDAAKKIWENVEDAAKYAFNASHSTSYGLTAYVDAWLKIHYPTAFYTVVLRDQDEDKLPVLINEIKNLGDTELLQPDINISDDNFQADFKNNKIYWSLSRIKQLGPKAVQYIVQERTLYGDFYDLEDFIKRIFKSKFRSFNDDGTNETRERCPVTARSIRNLIFAGAFDKVENVGSVIERYGLLEKAAKLLGFNVTAQDVPEELKDKHYFWSRQQIALTGHGAIDYQRIWDNTEKSKSANTYKFIEFKDLNNIFFEQKRGVICASIISVSDKAFKDRKTGEKKHFGKIELQQNSEVNTLTIWDDWYLLKKTMKDSIGRILVAVANVKWSDYDEKNTLQINKSNFFQII